MQLEVAGGNMLIYLLCRAGATTELTGLQHLGLNSTILRVEHTKAPSQREWRQFRVLNQCGLSLALCLHSPTHQGFDLQPAAGCLAMAIVLWHCRIISWPLSVAGPLGAALVHSPPWGPFPCVLWQLGSPALLALRI